MNDYSNHQNIYKKSTMIKMSALFVCLNKKVVCLQNLCVKPKFELLKTSSKIQVMMSGMICMAENLMANLPRGEYIFTMARK